MKPIKVSEATGAVLGWMVAKCEGKNTAIIPSHSGGYDCVTDWFKPSTNWAQGGPIIEREEISTQHTGDAAKWRAHAWDDERQDFWPTNYGPTLLIAAMRCYCCSKLGDTVEVPEELCK